MFKKIRSSIVFAIILTTSAALMIIGTLSYLTSRTLVYRSHSDVISESATVSRHLIDEYINLISANFKSGDFAESLADDIRSQGEINEDTAERAADYCSFLDTDCKYAVLSSDRQTLFSHGFETESDIPLSSLLSPDTSLQSERASVSVSDGERSQFNIVIPIVYENQLLGYQLICISDAKLDDMFQSQYLSLGTKELHCFVTAEGEFVGIGDGSAVEAERYADEFEYQPTLTDDGEFFTVKSQSDCGITFITLFSADGYKSSLKHMRTLIFLLGLTMLVLAFVVATLFADGITKPLTKLYVKIKNTDIGNNNSDNK